MIGRVFLTLICFSLLLAVFALDPLPQEALKARLYALEGQIEATEAVIDARWQELKKIDKLISVLWQESQDLNDDPSSKIKVDALLDLEEKLSQLHSRRIITIHLIETGYEEREALNNSIIEVKKSLSLRRNTS